MNIVADNCHLSGSILFGGGGGGGGKDFVEPDQQAHFDHFPHISTHIFQGISN